MTALTDRPPHEAPEVGRLRRKNRLLAVTLVVVVVAMVGLGAWILFDYDSSEAAPPAEVLEVIRGYEEAVTTNNAQLAESITTEDFTRPYVLYPLGGLVIFDEADMSRADVIRELTYGEGWSEWVVSPIGEARAVGEGPWHVSVPTSFSLKGNAWEGISLYTIVDDA